MSLLGPRYVQDMSQKCFLLREMWDDLSIFKSQRNISVSTECTELARARAGSSQKARAGLARLGSETKLKSELGSARARNNFEFPS